MSDDTLPSPRRRPVDVLFGEEVELKPKPTQQDTDVKQSPPGYMVELPRPVTSVRPPPPEYPNDWRINPPLEPVTLIEQLGQMSVVPDVVMPPPKPPTEPLVVETIAEAVTFTTSPDIARPTPVEPPSLFVSPPPSSPAPSPAPAAATMPTSLYGQPELVELSQFVDQLYQNVADETSDSATLNTECLANLNSARVALERGEYAKAEASAEQVKARLLRARASRAATGARETKLLFGWLIVAALAGVVLFSMPFVFRIVPVVIPLFRGVALGMLGGTAAALFQLTRHIARRDYDAAFTSKYAISPLLGALVGAAMYLLSLLGILAAPNALGITIEPYLLMYLFALLGGFFSDVLFTTLRGLVTRRDLQLAGTLYIKPKEIRKMVVHYTHLSDFFSDR